MIDDRLINEVTQEDDRTKIYKIDASGRKITAISGLRAYERLRCLVLDFNLISTIDGLNALADLRELHLEGNSLSKISQLEGNKALQVLNLKRNCIEKIEGISHLGRLETLLLDNNLLIKLQVLEYLKELKVLSVRNNRIESVDNLPAFSKLQVLLMSNNRIKTISNSLFAHSHKLTILDLAQNCVVETGFLVHCVGLQVLSLRDNYIEELMLPSCIPVLQTLNVSNNRLATLPYIGTVLPELISLDISNNMICSEVDLINAIAQADSLTEIDFRGNPMYTDRFGQIMQKNHNFDYLNGVAVQYPGSKYHEQINRVSNDLEGPHVYEEDEEDRKLRFSGFYNDELQYKMTGIKPNRHPSPKCAGSSKQVATDQQLLDDLKKSFKDFMINDSRIKAIREQYLRIYENSGLKKPQNNESVLTTATGKGPDQSLLTEPNSMRKSELSGEQYESKECLLLKENEKNQTKWKDIKQREKSFNIRDVVKKTTGRVREFSAAKAASSSNGFVASIKSEYRLRNDLLKTQMQPGRASGAKKSGWPQGNPARQEELPFKKLHQESFKKPLTGEEIALKSKERVPSIKKR